MVVAVEMRYRASIFHLCVCVLTKTVQFNRWHSTVALMFRKPIRLTNFINFAKKKNIFITFY